MSKSHLLAFGFAGALFCTGALADPILPVSVTDVGVDWTEGEGTTTNVESIYYAGPILMTINGLPTIVWCDDLYNYVYIGSSDQYYLTDANDADAYLSPLSQTTDDEIAGLAYEGTVLYGTLSPDQGAEYQVAIWELEYAGLTDTDSTFQAGVTALIGDSLTFYADMLAAGDTYGELESPGCNQAPGTITYTNGCQIQGQIVISPNGGINLVPEPDTLALLGGGLFFLGWQRSRRKFRR